jgi:tetratricopeptide (TPR) repeat protein
MAENETNSADAAAISDGAETATPEEKTLTEKQLESFTAALEADPKDAYGRWGLALFHTLSDDQAQAQLGLLKINAQDALGHYNQGVVLASKGKYADAARAFAQASELDPQLAEAVFNQALAEEQAGNAAAARKLWNRYLEICDDPEESAEVKSHLTELANR